MKKIFLFLLLAVTACKNQSSEPDLDIRYDAIVPEVHKKVAFSDLIEDYYFIKLETNDECLLGDIKQLLFYDSKIYIRTEGIHCFDVKGKHLFSINNQGRGPDEYQNIHNISLDANKLFLYDNFGSKLMIYNINTGELLEKQKIPYSVRHIVLVNDTMWNDGPVVPNQYVSGCRVFTSFINQPTNVINSFFEEDYYTIVMENQFWGYDKSAYFIDPFRNLVYKNDNDQMIKYFRVNLMDRSLDASVSKLMIEKRSLFIDPLKERGGFYYLHSFNESSNYIMCNAHIGSSMATIVFNKNTKESVAYYINAVSNEPFEFKPVTAVAVYEEYFCQPTSPVMTSFILEQYRTIKMNDSTFIGDKRFEEFFIDHTENDNPILIMYKFTI